MYRDARLAERARADALAARVGARAAADDVACAGAADSEGLLVALTIAAAFGVSWTLDSFIWFAAAVCLASTSLFARLRATTVAITDDRLVVTRSFSEERVAIDDVRATSVERRGARVTLTISCTQCRALRCSGVLFDLWSPVLAMQFDNIRGALELRCRNRARAARSGS